MRKRGLCCGPVSVTFVNAFQTAEDIVKLLCRPVSPINLVFDLQRRYQIPRGTPSAGTQNRRGWENLVIFLQSKYISETVRYRPMVTMER